MRIVRVKADQRANMPLGFDGGFSIRCPGKDGYLIKMNPGEAASAAVFVSDEDLENAEESEE